jgi:hypothetical protein
MATDDGYDPARKDEDRKQWPCGWTIKDCSAH